VTEQFPLLHGLGVRVKHIPRSDTSVSHTCIKDKVVDVKTRGKKLSVRSECKLCQPFGIATWRTTGAVRDVRVRALPAAEKE
jgi:hypothetical protein